MRELHLKSCPLSLREKRFRAYAPISEHLSLIWARATFAGSLATRTKAIGCGQLIDGKGPSKSRNPMASFRADTEARVEPDGETPRGSSADMPARVEPDGEAPRGSSADPPLPLQRLDVTRLRKRKSRIVRNSCVNGEWCEEEQNCKRLLLSRCVRSNGHHQWWQRRDK